MIDFVFDEDLAEVEVGGSSFGTLDTGVYKVEIQHAALDKTKGGNNTLSLGIKTEDGRETTIWSAFGTIDKLWASGKENFGYKDFQAFMAACGAKSITPVPYELKKSDGTKIKDLTVVKELHGVTCTLAIQKVFDSYNGNVRESNEIHSSYNAKGQTYLEAKTNAPAEKINKVAERLKDKETKAYKAANAGGVSVVAEEEESGESLL